MKIVIEGTAKAVVDQEQLTLCYNSIKRNEEDLRRHIPQLKDFHLVIRKAMAVMAYHPKNLHCRHKLSNDRTSLTLTFGYRLEPPHHEIIKAVEHELRHLKMVYD